jgi:hypothetical protein
LEGGGVRTKQKIIEELELENAALRRNISDLKFRHDKAIDCPVDAAAGYGTKLEDGSVCTKTMVKNRLAYIAKLPLREGP